ncbi:MAG: type III polyketide synthase [Bacteroidetes bacterium]|nr:type III polyketide synthase [Bacteroidota bacterium]
MSVIFSISTAVPEFKHKQMDIFQFMKEVYHVSENEERSLKILYERSGIESRYSTIADYSLPPYKRTFYPTTQDLEPFPKLEERMEYFNHKALELSLEAIQKCMGSDTQASDITDLITVTCTGISAPGLDILVMEALKLNSTINRTSVNFMGCYAAIHAMKQADAICKINPHAVVLVMCVELCTLHFQKEFDKDNIGANLLFADGASALLVTGEGQERIRNRNCLHIRDFYSEISLSGKSDMAWQIGGKGFLMTLSSYIPELIKVGIKSLVHNALLKLKLDTGQIKHWAIHPGGRKILEVIQNELQLSPSDLGASYLILKEYGNMSSPTILFVLNEIWERRVDWNGAQELIFGAGFGPGLTMETFVLEGTNNSNFKEQ